MAETAAVDPQAPEDALAEPTRNVSWVFLLSITLANLGIMMVLITPLNNLLPRYTQAITGGDGKEAALAVVMASSFDWHATGSPGSPVEPCPSRCRG